MTKINEKKHFIGVDISKNTLDISLIDHESYGKFHDKQVQNSFQGYDAIINWLEGQNKKLEDCLFCMEHTGTYGLLFFAWLSQMEIDYCVESGIQIKRSMGMARGKNDRVDARRIADYAYTNRVKLKLFKMPSTLIIQIKQLLTYREQAVRIRTSLKNSIKSHKQYQRISGFTEITQQIQEQIQQQDQLIEKTEKQIKDLIKSDPQMKKNFELITSITGIGLIIAGFMLVNTNNFTCFENGRKYACYVGIAPFENTSGSSLKGKTQVSHLGNKIMKKLLSNGANSAYIHDSELNAYYNRKMAEGKDHKLIINAISCKLVNRAFAVVKRQAPYVKIYQHNFT